MAPRTRRRILGSLVAAGMVGLTLAIVLSRRTPPRPPLPDPNGYDDFVAAGKVIRGTGRITDQREFDRDRLRAVVATNQEALRLLRLGLSRQCSVPTDSALTNIPNWSTELAGLKRLAQLLGDEGRLHEVGDRPQEAALTYAQIIRYGNETSRGGFLIHRLVGISCEAIGCNLLAQLVPKLEGKGARPAIAELEKVDNARVTWDEIRRNEQRLPTGTFSSILNPVRWLRNRWLARRQSRMAEVRVRMVVAQERLLLTELALRCYLSEREQAPADLGVLMPDYLSRVPEDPFSRKPLVFRPQGTNWLLYSVGTDRVDDGGKPKGRGIKGKGDLFFDTPHY